MAIINSDTDFQAAVRRSDERKKDPTHKWKAIMRLFGKLSWFGARRSAG